VDDRQAAWRALRRRRIGYRPDMGASLASSRWPNAASRRRRIRCIRCRKWPWTGRANQRRVRTIPMFRPPIFLEKDSRCIMGPVQQPPPAPLPPYYGTYSSTEWIEEPTCTVKKERPSICDMSGSLYRVAIYVASGLSCVCVCVRPPVLALTTAWPHLPSA
jgi:hypothetical protein